MQGFRPGKVPFNMIKRQYQRRVEAEVMGDVIQTTYEQALSAEGLHPAGSPALQSQSLKADDVFEYAVTFEIYPDFEVKGLDKLTIEKPTVQVTDKNIDKMLEILRRQRTTWRDVTRKARQGDRLSISFDGKIAGEGFAGSTAENIELILGNHIMPSDFEDQLLGSKPGEEKTFAVTFADDYQGTAVAGKTATFVVKVGAVQEAVLPPVDDAFIRSFGVDKGGIARLREDIRENMQRELAQAVQAKVKAQIMEGLLEHNPIALPKTLVDEEIARMRSSVRQDQQRAGGKKAAAELPPASMFEQQAQRWVRLGLLVGELIKSNSIELDREKFDAEVKTIAATYEDSAMVERMYRESPDLRRKIEATVMENQLIDVLLGMVNITEVEKDFYEVVQHRG